VRRFLIALALIAAIGGCGGGAPSQRDQVAGYIQQVDKIESELAAPLRTVTQASGRFTHTQPSAAGAGTALAGVERELVAALGQIRGLRDRLAALKAPSPARRLRELLLEVAGREAAMTREVAMMVTYLPRFSAGLVPLAPASKRLSAALSQTQPSAYGAAGVSQVFAAKAAALGVFGAQLQSVENQLRGLHPPPVSMPGYTAQVTTLQQMRASAGRLATALAAQDRARIPALLHDFDVAAVANRSVAAQQAQIAAVRAYDARARQLDQLAIHVQAERARLARTLK
jgi:hypothetical protein